jgi:hypothetical protein
MRFLSPFAASVLLGCMLSANAQQLAPAAVYKVQLELQPDAGASNRTIKRFTLLVQPARTSIFKAIDSIPMEAGTGSNTIDVGTSVECGIEESEGRFKLHGNLEISQITGTVNLNGVAQPIVGQRKLAFHQTVESGKPTLISKLLTATVTKSD